MLLFLFLLTVAGPPPADLSGQWAGILLARVDGVDHRRSLTADVRHEGDRLSGDWRTATLHGDIRGTTADDGSVTGTLTLFAKADTDDNRHCQIVGEFSGTTRDGGVRLAVTRWTRAGSPGGTHVCQPPDAIGIVLAARE